MDRQQEVIAFLSAPAAFGLPADTPVERIETHISIVWLAGDRAYKLKRAVTYDYVDFSDLETRRQSCEVELRLNRRTAPTLYLAVRAVTRDAGGRLALDGGGAPIEWLVEMRRFDQDLLFDRLAARGALDLGLMDPLGEAIAALYASAEPRADRGGQEAMAWVVDGNAAAFEAQLSGADRMVARRVSRAARAAVARHGAQLDARRRDGLVRWCHGDLHLRNIVLLNGSPVLFDALEFNDRMACVDVFYDLAFLLMDLWHRRLPAHANAVFNTYLARTTDFEGVSLLPLFLSCRAAIRAKTSAAGATLQRDASRARDLQRAAREYLTLAGRLLQPLPPRLVAIGGLSGSGKSTLARRLAPGVGAVPGAVVLRSDVIRKQQHGVQPLTRLGPDAYTPAATRRVYQTIADLARSVLRAGHAVVADAVYRSAQERHVIADVAREAGVPFVGLWLDAPSPMLASRLATRAADASDATAAVLAQQVEAGVGTIDWPVLDASANAEIITRDARELVGASR